MNKNTSESTILVISMGFLVIYLIFSYQWAVYVSLTFGIIGIVSKTLSELIEKGWIKLSYLLSYIVPPILLSIVFYLFLFPISLVFRIFNKDSLLLSDQYNTYFFSVQKNTKEQDFEKMW